MLLNEVLSADEPLLLVLTHGASVPTDVNKELQRAEKGGLTVLRVNVDEQPDYAQQFEIGKHMVLLTLHQGEIVARRSRPWGTDAGEMVTKALALVPAKPKAKNGNGAADAPNETDLQATGTPVEVTDATFVAEVMESDIPVLIDFWAEWCGPCRMVAPILEKLAGEFAGQVKIAKVDVDQNPMLSQQFRIQSIPTMMFVKNGKIVGQSAGAAPEGAIRDALKQLIALAV